MNSFVRNLAMTSVFLCCITCQVVCFCISQSWVTFANVAFGFGSNLATYRNVAFDVLRLRRQNSFIRDLAMTGVFSVSAIDLLPFTRACVELVEIGDVHMDRGVSVNFKKSYQP